MSEQSAHRACRATGDLWAFPADAYERDHEEAILSSLLKGAYRRAFESACGQGSLTERLAPSCQRLIAVDMAPTAVARTRVRCSQLPQVSVRCAGLTDYLPDGPLDLVILRDAMQPLTAAELLRVGLELCERLAPGGELVALHGVERRTTSSWAGNAIHEVLHTNLPLHWARGQRSLAYRMDTWIKH